MQLMLRTRGFTLLETLVALAILAIGLSAAMRATSATTTSSAELQTRMLADWVAQNRLAELRATGAWPETGRNEGEAVQANFHFRWREEISATPNPLFRRVDVRVFGEGGGDHALAVMSGFVVRPLR